MSSDPQRAQDVIEHIAQAIDRINRYTELGKEHFVNSEITQDAVIRNLEVIGEASRSIEKRFPEFAVAHRDLPLRSAYEMRNALSHGYFKIDIDIVWKTIEQDLPGLREKIRQIVGN